MYIILYMYVYIYICMYIYRDTTYIYIYIFLYTEPLPPLLQSSHEWKMEKGDYVCIYMYIYIYIYIYMYIYLHSIHIHIHISIYITPSPPPSPSVVACWSFYRRFSYRQGATVVLLCCLWCCPRRVVVCDLFSCYSRRMSGRWRRATTGTTSPWWCLPSRGSTPMTRPPQRPTAETPQSSRRRPKSIHSII